MKHAISWFEIAVEDYGRAKKFYEKILATELGEMEVGDSKMALLTADQDPDVVGGALIKSTEIKPSTDGTIVYINANPDLQTVLDRIIAVGCEVFVPKTSIGPDMGFFAQFSDSEGNRVGLFSHG